eukprot:symbB.v1.2.037634.t1/scaffold5611.1/size25361/1
MAGCLLMTRPIIGTLAPDKKVAFSGRRPNRGVSLSEVPHLPVEPPKAGTTARFDEEWDLVQTAVSITETLNLLQDHWSTPEVPELPCSEKEPKMKQTPRQRHVAEEVRLAARLRDLQEEQRAHLHGLEKTWQQQRRHEECLSSVLAADVDVGEGTSGSQDRLQRDEFPEPEQKAFVDAGCRSPEKVRSLWRAFRDTLGLRRREVELLQ